MHIMNSLFTLHTTRTDQTNVGSVSVSNKNKGQQNLIGSILSVPLLPVRQRHQGNRFLQISDERLGFDGNEIKEINAMGKNKVREIAMERKKYRLE